MVSGKWELPPSMMTSPASRWGSTSSMNSSTASPALTISMTLRGRFSSPAISSMEWAPMTFLWPLAASFRKASTLETVRLKATTVYPWSLILRIRFWPMTASPISAMSAVGSMIFARRGLEITVSVIARGSGVLKRPDGRLQTVPALSNRQETTIPLCQDRFLVAARNRVLSRDRKGSAHGAARHQS